jgi:hypothetical protein
MNILVLLVLAGFVGLPSGAIAVIVEVRSTRFVAKRSTSVSIQQRD